MFSFAQDSIAVALDAMHSFGRLFAIASLAVSLASAAPHSAKREDAQSCNGHPSLCDKSFGDVVFIGAHDSYAVDNGGLSAVASNQNIDVPSQLNMGVRLLQAQTHLKDDVLHVCHTDCALYDGGSLEDYFRTISNWLSDDANRNEVLTLVVTNNDNVEVAKWADIFKASGLEQFVFTPASSPVTRDAWPKMADLISANTCGSAHGLQCRP